MIGRRLVQDRFTAFGEADWRRLAGDPSGHRPRLPGWRVEDRIDIPILSAASAADPVAGRTPGAPWLVVERIDGGNAAEAMGAAAAGGARGVELVFRGSAVERGGGLDPADGSWPDAAGGGLLVRIDGGERSHAIAARANRPKVAVAFDPIATLAARGRLRSSYDALMDKADEYAQASAADRFSAEVVIADGRPWNDAGASDVQELAIVLATFVQLLRAFHDRGRKTADAAGRIGVAMAATADQFASLAKFRAIRLLLGRALEIAGAAAVRPRIHGEAAWRMLAPRTPEVNLLRGTVAAFAMAAGGADSIAVLPARPGGADFDRRMARNTQLILEAESALARVSDPAAGSGAVDGLTSAFAEAAWDRFREIELAGGILAAVRTGSVQAETGRMGRERLARVARREVALVGVNLHVGSAAAAAPRPPAPDRAGGVEDDAPAGETAPPLTPLRLSADFDRLRETADALAASGRRPRVLLVGSGGRSRQAELDAADALAAGGVEAVFAASGRDLGEVLASAAVPAACICCDDDARSGDVGRTVARLAAAGAHPILVFHPAESVDPADGRTTPFLAPGSDLADSLRALLEAFAGPAGAAGMTVGRHPGADAGSRD